MPAEPTDNLVYDCELGWIDPEFPLESRGVTVQRDRGFLQYHLGYGRVFRLRLDSDWPLLRRILEDAERRARREGDRDG